MLDTTQQTELANSLNMTLNDFTLASAISGTLLGFTITILILYLISNMNIKG